MNRSFSEHCAGALVVTNLEGVILESNREADRALGERGARGASLLRGVDPEDQIGFAARWAALVSSPGGAVALGVCRFLEAQGNFRSYAWSAARAPLRDEVHATLIPLPEPEAHPASEKETRSTLRLADPAVLLRGLLDHCGLILCVFDREGRFVVQDGKGLEAVGLRQGQFLGQNVFDLYGNTSDGASSIRRTLTLGEVTHYSEEQRDVLFESWSFPLRDERGEIMGVANVTLDKSDTQRALQDLKNKLDLIERQQEVIRDLETPIIQVWDQVLTLPMVGMVDSQRAARVMNDLLSMVVDKSARYAILDLTGVETVDTATASHLLQMVAAIRLLGAEGIISGIRPTVAQTMVMLGVDLAAITTCSNLQEALRICIRRLSASKASPSA